MKTLDLPRALPLAVGALTCCAPEEAIPDSEDSDPSSASSAELSPEETEFVEDSDDLDAAMRAQLKAIGYVDWDPAANPEARGVVYWDVDAAQPGYNLYAVGKKVFLRGLDGEAVHEWQLDRTEGNPFAKLHPDGSLLAGVDGALVRLTWDGEELWRLPLGVHHDVALVPDGSFRVWYAETHEHVGRLVAFDGVAHVSADGELLSKWWSYDHLEHLREHHGHSALDRPRTRPGPETVKVPPSYHHANSIELLGDTELGRRDPRFRAGNWLISLPKFDCILVLDGDDQRVTWTWGPSELEFQHMPTQLENGNLLIFDNGMRRGWSRVIELDPVTEEFRWIYQAEPREAFFSKHRGSCQRLANGNTLICESERGHAFEVTPQHEVVWDFWNPEVEDEKRRRIYRLTRYPPSMVEPRLR